MLVDFCTGAKIRMGCRGPGVSSVARWHPWVGVETFNPALTLPIVPRAPLHAVQKSVVDPILGAGRC